MVNSSKKIARSVMISGVMALSVLRVDAHPGATQGHGSFGSGQHSFGSGWNSSGGTGQRQGGTFATPGGIGTWGTMPSRAPTTFPGQNTGWHNNNQGNGSGWNNHNPGQGGTFSAPGGIGTWGTMPGQGSTSQGSGWHNHNPTQGGTFPTPGGTGTWGTMPGQASTGQGGSGWRQGSGSGSTTQQGGYRNQNGNYSQNQSNGSWSNGNQQFSRGNTGQIDNVNMIFVGQDYNNGQDCGVFCSIGAPTYWANGELCEAGVGFGLGGRVIEVVDVPVSTYGQQQYPVSQQGPIYNNDAGASQAVSQTASELSNFEGAVKDKINTLEDEIHNLVLAQQTQPQNARHSNDSIGNLTDGQKDFAWGTGAGIGGLWLVSKLRKKPAP